METQKADIVGKLLNSHEPSVRFKLLVHILKTDGESAAIKRLQEEIKASPRVQQLFSERDEDGNLPYHPYAKWYGAHWVLADPADIGYPPGDQSLIPLRERVYQWLFGQSHQSRIQTIAGRVRRCASQEGNALYYLLTRGRWPNGLQRFSSSDACTNGKRMAVSSTMTL